MPEIPASYIELGRISHHSAPATQSSSAAAAPTEREAPAARDRITRGEQAARRSKLPSLKSLATTVIGLGAGAGVYRLGEFAHTNLNKTPPVPGFEPVGNLLVNSTLLGDFRQAAAIMEKDPKTNQTLNFLLTAKPNFLGNPLTIRPDDADQSDTYEPILNAIYWDPKAKYAVPPSNSSDALGGLSPFGALQQYAILAQHAGENLAAYLSRSACADPNYDDKESRLSIEEANVKLANFPGETARSDDNYAFTMPAANVTDNTLSGLEDAMQQANLTAHGARQYHREYYSQTGDTFLQALGDLYTARATAFSTLSQLRDHVSGAIDNGDLLRLSALAEEGIKLTVSYDTARNGFGVPAAFIEADNNYTQRVKDFATHLQVAHGKNVQSPNRTFGAPPLQAPPLAPETAPSAAPAPGDAYRP